MPEIAYQSLKDYIQENLPATPDPVYLIFGEEFLYQEVVRNLVDIIIPAANQRHQYEIINHKEDSLVSDVIERMNTYSFFSEKKILELREATVFVSGHNQGAMLQKILQEYEKNEFEKAAKKFLSLLSRLQLNLEDLAPALIAQKFNISDEEGQAADRIKKIIEYCRDRQLSVPESGDDADRLKKAIERGFPKNNILFITTDTVDKRKALYQTIKKTGTIIDCTIAKGNRKADIDVQRKFLQRHMRRFLQKHGKQIESQAFDRIFKMTGFDLRAFTTNLEKLVDYAKDRDRITVDDVHAVLIRTRQDPVYELTGAVSDRNVLKTLHFMSSLLDSGFHYLQILAAVTNQIRKMLVIKGFLESRYGRAWHPGIGFERFKKEIMPLIVKYDEDLSETIQYHQNAIKGRSDSLNVTKKQKSSSDLMIAKNPNNPYPVYQQFLKSQNYRKEELFTAFEILNDADVRLKSTGQSPKTILEQVVFQLCRKRNEKHDMP